MPIKKTYYEILGVSRAATLEQIKRRYRQLVRRYHPDVAQDKAAAKAAFIEIAEAYQTLISPDKRTIYDASLDAEMFRVPPSRPAEPRAPGVPGYRAQRPQAPAARGRAAQAERWIREAQAAFIRGQFRSAVTACREAQSVDPRNVQAHIILGDIYRIQGQLDNAIAMYAIVVQLDPGNADVHAKLNRLLYRSGARVPGVSLEREAALKMGLNLVGWSMAAFLLVLLAVSPGQPIVWLKHNMPYVGVWSTMLIATLGIIGALAGFLLSVNGTLQPLDDELVFQSVRAPGRRTASYPIGLILIVLNFFNFYLAAAAYVFIGLIQESLSRSLLKAFAATFCLTVLAFLVYAPDPPHVLLFGGNVVFPALLFGWAMGDLFRPGW
ncbi:MAG TPA: DnaJ domain-containing protein [Armatimonadota bacterium]|nr:DnaJ domain-containing protein [Armatimonadota bacterium]